MAMPVVTLIVRPRNRPPVPLPPIPPIPQYTLPAGEYAAHVSVAPDGALTITITGLVPMQK